MPTLALPFDVCSSVDSAGNIHKMRIFEGEAAEERVQSYAFDLADGSDIVAFDVSHGDAVSKFTCKFGLPDVSIDAIWQ